MLDVGQGLAVHVQTAGHDLVYDTGPAFSADANSGERILLPYLRSAGIRHLDTLVVTHQDNDHAGGAEALLAGIPVRAVLSSLPENHPVRLIAGARGQACAAGQSWEWDGVRFAMLYPDTDVAPPTRKTNDSACVLRVEASGRRLLLSSDIEAASEARLLARDREALASDVLVVPHHGEPNLVYAGLHRRDRAALGDLPGGLSQSLSPSQSRRVGTLGRHRCQLGAH